MEKLIIESSGAGGRRGKSQTSWVDEFSRNINQWRMNGL